MLRLIVGIALGLIGGYLYGNERARDQARRRLANAPDPVRQATERISGVIARAPIADALKQRTAQATAAVQHATARAAPAPDVVRPSAAEVATRPAEPLPRYEPEAPA
jgi:hypothetical protein